MLCLPDDYEDLTSHFQNITTGAFSTYRVWLLDYSDVWYWQNNFDRYIQLLYGVNSNLCDFADRSEDSFSDK